MKDRKAPGVAPFMDCMLKITDRLIGVFFDVYNELGGGFWRVFFTRL